MNRTLSTFCAIILFSFSFILLSQATESDPILTVSFKEINAKGYPIFLVTNISNRDIDDIKAGFQIRDSENNIIYSSGQTDATPGNLFLASGDIMEYSPYGLKRKPEIMKLLQSKPDSLTFSFKIREITYMK